MTQLASSQGGAAHSPSSKASANGEAGANVLMDQVVMFGDSITQGSWVAGGTGAELANKWQRKLDVVNRGLSGYNTEWAIPIMKQWLPRTDERLPGIRLMFVWFGANDACLPPSPQAISIKRFKENLHTISSLLRSPTSPYHSPTTQLVFITPPPVDADTRNSELASRDPPRPADRDAEWTRKFAEAVKEVAAELKVPAVDVWTRIDEAAKRDGGLETYLSDGLHLTPAAYEIVTAAITETIQRDLPHLHWDNLEQTFPHWTHWIPPSKRF
ncbi:hypothetical protein JCM8547_000701 [Rhodosporidiobolus lusitaniae]